MASRGWYYARDKRKVGPIDFAELSQLAGAGGLRPTDMVLEQGSTKWQAASTLAGLFPVAVAAHATLGGATPAAPAADVEAGNLETIDGRQSNGEGAPGPSTTNLPRTGSVAGAASAADSTPDLLALGSFGRYRILQKLGQGGMGAVYLAHDQQLDRRVALKVPKFTTTENEAVLQRFHTEARSAATLVHPNICPLYDVGELGGIHYLTMAYIEGQTLREHIRQRLPFPERQAAELLRVLALALHEAHGHGIVHRDLKPANVLINQRGEPIVMDFGLARRQQQEAVHLTQTGQIMGTPAYMSPEQVDGVWEAIGPATDIYSLGVMLYEMLAGRLPFIGSGPSVFGQIMAVDPALPSVHRPGLDPNLEAICLKAMAKKPKDRFESMSEFASALTAYLGYEGRASSGLCDATTAAFTGFASPKRKFRKWGLMASAAGAVAIMALAIVLMLPAKEGTIRIELSDASANVEVKIDDVAIARTALSGPITLRPGPHLLIVAGTKFETFRESFTVRAGENPALSVTLQSKKVAAAANPAGEIKKATQADKESAKTLADQASKQLDDGKFKQAVAESSAAIKLDSDCLDAYYVRGLAHLRLRDYDNAIADFTEMIRLDPKDADAYGNRAVAFCYRGRDRGDSRDFDHALGDADAQVKLLPEDTLSYSTRALAHAYLGSLDLAIADCNKSMQIDPNNWQAYSTRGLANLKKKDYDAVIADYTKAFSFGVKNPNYSTDRGQAYLHKGLYDSAIADFDAAIKLAPAFAPAYQYRGDAYAKKGDLVKANADHDKAKALERK